MRRRSRSPPNLLLAALMALAVAEHWFLVVPIDANAIWRSFRRKAGGDEGDGAALRVEQALAGTAAPAPSAAATNSEQQEFVERLSSGGLRRAKRCVGSRSRRGRALRRSGKRSGAHAHECELGLLRGRQRARANGGLRPAPVAGASDDRDRTSVRPGPAAGRARRLRRSSLTKLGMDEKGRGVT